MLIMIDGRALAHAADQGRLGKDVEERLHALADLVERMHQSEPEERDRRALDVVTCTIRQLSYLAHRKREVGRLCGALDKELMMAESIIVDLNAIARSWCSGEVTHPVPEVDEGWVTLIPRMPRSDYMPYMMLLVRFIRQRFPGETAERWEETARMALETKAGQTRSKSSRQSHARSARSSQ